MSHDSFEMNFETRRFHSVHLWSRRLLVLAVALIAASVFPRIASAQTGKLTGVATDASTGQPLEGVQIFLPGTGYGSITGSSGRYFILNVPPGTYQVSARRIGYATTNTNNPSC